LLSDEMPNENCVYPHFAISDLQSKMWSITEKPFGVELKNIPV
jgi:hypothetical protein